MAGRMPQTVRERIYHRNMHALYLHVRDGLKVRYAPFPVDPAALHARLKEEAGKRGYSLETPGGRHR